MERVEKIDPKTDFYSGAKTYGAVLGVPVPTTPPDETSPGGYLMVSNSAVAHYFDPQGNEIRSKRVQLTGATLIGLSAIKKGMYARSAFITMLSGDTYVIRGGRVLMHLASGTPPTGLGNGTYTPASQFSDDVMVLGDTRNELIFVNLRTKKVKVVSLSHIEGGKVLAPPLVVGDTVFATSTDGHLYKLKFDPDSMTVASKEDTNFGESIEAPPVLLTNGDLVVATNSGRVVFMNQDFGPGKLPNMNIGSPVDWAGLQTERDSLLVIGKRGGKSILGLINTVTKATGNFVTSGPVSNKVPLIRHNGKEVFVIVDDFGGGYVTDTWLRPLGTFHVGEDPYCGAVVMGGKIRVSTCSSRLATIRFKNFKDSKVELVP